MKKIPQRLTLSSITLLILALLISPPSASARRAAVGRPAPVFEVLTLDGKTTGIEHLKGRVVLIDFWATWCEPCLEELPELNVLYKDFKAQGLEILAISVDRERENIEKFLKEFPLDFPVIHDKGKKIANRFKPRAMPTAFIVDQEGIVRYVHLGFKTSFIQKYRDQIGTLLKNGAQGK